MYGIPVNIVHGNSTAKVNVIIDNYPGESDIVPVPIPANAVIEGDYQNGPNPERGRLQRRPARRFPPDHLGRGHQHRLRAVRRDAPYRHRPCFPTPDGVELPHTDGLWHAAQETVWNMNTDTFRTLGETSADAAGLSILAGLVRPDEGLPVSQGGQGVIDHALRVTLPSGDVNPQYIYPASHMVNVSQGANNLPFGGRLRLANTPAIDALISNMPPESQIIARAMQQYGLIVADIGSAMYVTGTSATVDNVDSPNLDLTWNLNDIFASNGLEALNAGDFQVVNLTPVVTGLSATSGSAGSTITITGQNFSGAAGHLSVFFGSTAASSVTFVSDSQITAVVPSGTGTVNVTVQSGVNETDNISGNPNANVNKPIFGYGTSAVSTADQFTYSSQTISRDELHGQFRNADRCLGQYRSADHRGQGHHRQRGQRPRPAAPSASASRAAPAPARSAPSPPQRRRGRTRLSSPAPRRARPAPSPPRSTASRSAPSPPSRSQAGSVSATTSTVSFASPTVASGSTDLVTIVVKDAAGNAISGLASSAFSFALAGGTSAGTFGSVSATTTPGTYTAIFTGTTAGTASTLTATVSGVTLNTKPTVQVVADEVSGAKSAIKERNRRRAQAVHVGGDM